MAESDKTGNEIEFLTYEQVMAIHRSQLDLYGGADGVIDENVVQSAVGSARHTMFGKYLNEDLADMAASYLVGLATSQGFRDGNKRTAASCCDVFLRLNGYVLDCTDEELYDLTMGAATKVIDKDGVADWVRERAKAALP